MSFVVCLRLLVVGLSTAGLFFAAEHAGKILFGGLPLPGATVTATSVGRTAVRTISAVDGTYRFANLANGVWQIKVNMLLFAPMEQQVILSSGSPAELTRWELKTLSEAELAQAVVSPPRTMLAPAANSSGDNTAPAAKPSVQTVRAAAAEPESRSDPFADMRPRAADSFLINGTVNNGAASPFAQFAAFGNNRNNRSSLYNGNVGLTFDNSSLDARSYSLNGLSLEKPAYNRLQGLFSFGGPLRIPHLLKRNGPNFTVNYQWARNSNASTLAGLVPTVEQRNGDLSQGRSPVLDPLNGAPFANNVIPQSRISPQARVLLALYPLPNLPGNSQYNYQVPLLRGLHQDDLQVRANKQVSQKNYVAGSFAGQSVRTDTTNLLGFLDTGRVSGVNASLQWRHNFGQRLYGTLEYRYTRLTDRTTPYFADRSNVSGAAGIIGNNQDAANWGPPTLIFAQGLTPLSDAQSSLLRNQTHAISYGSYWNRGRHNVQFGVGYGRQQFNVLAQQDPRGTFTFTGQAAGSDLAGFLLGIPDASSIAFGNADKYLRSTSSSVYVTDDWRRSPGFTLNAGLRWEYASPVTERYGRLVSLRVGPGFRSADPVLATQGTLLRPDRNGFAPRVAFSWRPFSASSMVVRGGYGVYYDTGVYQPIALQMAQQAPLSKSLRVQNSPDLPLTLADGFRSSGAILNTTFGVDPDFRLGYSQTWQLSLQRDLPGALQMVAGYTGIKGTRAQQQFLPNTFAPGSGVVCACPSGFTYLTSNGNSTRQAANLQLRRRLRSGFAGQLQYTFAKSLDNATLGGAQLGSVLVAQDWLNLRAERGRSNFDQRHLVSLQAQYTSGMGLRGGTLWNGWRGRMLKEWTVASQVTAGTGLPLTPIYLSLVPGTGVTDSLRPDYTGAPLYDAPAGLALNPAAFVLPGAGRWGNAGRNSINGPAQFTMTASVGRTFRSTDRLSLDVRVDATNPLNNVTYPNWNTVVSSAQFGLPTVANPMRSLQTTVRARF